MWALHGAGGIRRPWKPLKGWTKVWSCDPACRRTAVGSALVSGVPVVEIALRRLWLLRGPWWLPGERLQRAQSDAPLSCRPARPARQTEAHQSPRTPTHVEGTHQLDLDRTSAAYLHDRGPTASHTFHCGPAQRWRRGCRCRRPDRTPSFKRYRLRATLEGGQSDITRWRIRLVAELSRGIVRLLECLRAAQLVPTRSDL